MFDPESRFSPSPGYVVEEIDGELLIFHTASEQMFRCNATAGLIWRLLDGARDVGAITRLLAEAWPEQAATITADVQSTLATLHAAGAIRAL